MPPDGTNRLAASRRRQLAQAPLTRISGEDIIELASRIVQGSIDAANLDPEGFRQAFAKQSAPLLATVPMPPPSRVTGFEVTSYEVT